MGSKLILGLHSSRSIVFACISLKHVPAVQDSINPAIPMRDLAFRWRLPKRVERSIARVTKPGNDVLLGIEMIVDSAGVQFDIRKFFRELGDTLWSC